MQSRCKQLHAKLNAVAAVWEAEAAAEQLPYPTGTKQAPELQLQTLQAQLAEYEAAVSLMDLDEGTDTESLATEAQAKGKSAEAHDKKLAKLKRRKEACKTLREVRSKFKG